LAAVTSWEQWRFDALVEAARRYCWGIAWWQQDGWAAYLKRRAAGVPVYLVPARW
jgi:hypothetical protein